MSWQIDPQHSHIQFSVRHMMISTVRGKFRDYTGTVDFDEENPQQTDVYVRINAASIDTQTEDRDNHLRSPDFLHVEEYPYITYQSKRIELIDERNARLIGDLTIRGETREVPVDVTYQGRSQSPWGDIRVGFTGEASFSRKDWNLTWNQALETGGWLVGDKITVDIELQLVKQDVEEAQEQIAEALAAAD
ncbi:MAG: YceI family protein [Candidatus Promineifilaceae bacterium]|nr:YceI family protein [Candidatus Promineifilaceae bacterium]